MCRAEFIWYFAIKLELNFFFASFSLSLPCFFYFDSMMVESHSYTLVYLPKLVASSYYFYVYSLLRSYIISQMTLNTPSKNNCCSLRMICIMKSSVAATGQWPQNQKWILWFRLCVLFLSKPEMQCGRWWRFAPLLKTLQYLYPGFNAHASQRLATQHLFQFQYFTMYAMKNWRIVHNFYCFVSMHHQDVGTQKTIWDNCASLVDFDCDLAEETKLKAIRFTKLRHGKTFEMVWQ